MPAETAAPPLFYEITADTDKALAAGELLGLDQELRSLRVYINDYMNEHKDELEKILKGMRLIMQMVLAQNRIGADRRAESLAAYEVMAADLRKQFTEPEEDDV